MMDRASEIEWGDRGDEEIHVDNNVFGLKMLHLEWVSMGCVLWEIEKKRCSDNISSHQNYGAFMISFLIPL